MKTDTKDFVQNTCCWAAFTLTALTILFFLAFTYVQDDSVTYGPVQEEPAVVVFTLLRHSAWVGDREGEPPHYVVAFKTPHAYLVADSATNDRAWTFFMNTHKGDNVKVRYRQVFKKDQVADVEEVIAIKPQEK